MLIDTALLLLLLMLPTALTSALLSEEDRRASDLSTELLLMLRPEMTVRCKPLTLLLLLLVLPFPPTSPPKGC